MPLVSFYTQWKYHKTLIILGGIERDQWHYNGLLLLFIIIALYLTSVKLQVNDKASAAYKSSL